MRDAVRGVSLVRGIRIRERAYNFSVHFVVGRSARTLLTAGWSSGLRPRLRSQRSWVQIPVVGRGFCDEQLHLLTSHGCLYIYIIINITYICTIYVCLSVI
jgi:hypothetical protein